MRRVVLRQSPDLPDNLLREIEDRFLRQEKNAVTETFRAIAVGVNC